ncbi:MAG: TolC family protein [Sulfurovum sp.]|nr:TolC family protein [Sulfurovaceae bacterium]
MKHIFYKSLPLVLLLLQACAGTINTSDLVSEAIVIEEVKTKSFYSDRSISGNIQNNWLYSFHDKRLNKLAKEALLNNLNLRVSALSIEEAVAQTKLASAALKPSIGYNAGLSNASIGGNSANAGFGASWQPDVWGRVSARVSSIKSTQKAIEADYAFAKQSLVADVSKAWFLLIESSKQEQLAYQILKEYKATLKIVSVKFEVGQVLRKDLSQANADLNAAKDSHVQAKNSLVKSSRALEILLGRYPKAEVTSKAQLPKLPKFPTTGVPANLLERRPDLIAKEERIRSAFFATQEAELARLPSFTLSIGGGLNNVNNLIGMLGAGLSGPIYTGGAIEAQIEGATATQKKVLASYQAVVLDAFRDVESTLHNEKVLKERLKILSLAVKDYQIAFNDTKVQYKLGQIELTLVQIQQRKLDASRSTKLHIESLLLQNRVNMYLSLGGGFNNENALRKKGKR